MSEVKKARELQPKDDKDQIKFELQTAADAQNANIVSMACIQEAAKIVDYDLQTIFRRSVPILMLLVHVENVVGIKSTFPLRYEILDISTPKTPRYLSLKSFDYPPNPNAANITAQTKPLEAKLSEVNDIRANCQKYVALVKIVTASSKPNEFWFPKAEDSEGWFSQGDNLYQSVITYLRHKIGAYSDQNKTEGFPQHLHDIGNLLKIITVISPNKLLTLGSSALNKKINALKKVGRGHEQSEQKELNQVMPYIEDIISHSITQHDEYQDSKQDLPLSTYLKHQLNKLRKELITKTPNTQNTYQLEYIQYCCDLIDVYNEGNFLFLSYPQDLDQKTASIQNVPDNEQNTTQRQLKYAQALTQSITSRRALLEKYLAEIITSSTTNAENQQIAKQSLAYLKSIAESNKLQEKLKKLRDTRNYSSFEEKKKHELLIKELAKKLSAQVYNLPFDTTILTNKVHDSLTIIPKQDIEKQPEIGTQSIETKFNLATQYMDLAGSLEPTDEKQTSIYYKHANEALSLVLADLDKAVNNTNNKKDMVLKLQALEAKAKVNLALGDTLLGYVDYLQAYRFCINHKLGNWKATAIQLRQQLINLYKRFMIVIESKKTLQPAADISLKLGFSFWAAALAIYAINDSSLATQKPLPHKELVDTKEYDIDDEYLEINASKVENYLTRAQMLFANSFNQLKTTAIPQPFSPVMILEALISIMTTTRNIKLFLSTYNIALNFARAQNIHNAITQLTQIVREYIYTLEKKVTTDDRKSSTGSDKYKLLEKRLQESLSHIDLMRCYKEVGNSNQVASHQKTAETLLTAIIKKAEDVIIADSRTPRLTVTPFIKIIFQYHELKINALKYLAEMCIINNNPATAEKYYQEAAKYFKDNQSILPNSNQIASQLADIEEQLKQAATPTTNQETKLAKKS